ncbi:efflux RND transporter periplasmic adaptor subunit [Flavobacterium sp. MC2016-06]|uniref:efflux RND transporter periplasmic adaptor subunit n=1 Tax=Flavobacterium sp. MC2016-06 TaxID=2676308 RepID=UPI0012BAFAA8|nr:efflux RND transporter periplasmic adaptor subunit [Flavobacterium sp. MC2016-06]MBU3858413.1 efflux RND transporter periplasmic adaptor subunit [Flavobacterium sp. MC2016-06]
MKNKKNKIVGAISLAFIVIAIYCSFSSGTNEVPVKAESLKAKIADIKTTVTATGTIQPVKEVEVGTQVSGVVEKIYVDYNTVVKKGQLIAELDKTNLQAALVQAKALYESALNEKNYLQRIFDRQKTLFDSKVISRSDYDEALYNLNNAKSTVVQRLSDLQKAQTNLSYATIYSPIDGVILSKAVDEGQTVAASYSTPTLFTIAKDLTEMQVEANVDEADIGQVKEGQRVTFTVDAYQGEEFQGVITQVRLNATTTSNVVTYTVVIKADNPDLKLKPGLTATISIYTLELKNVLTIEAKAANFEPDAKALATYQKQNNLKAVPLQENKTKNEAQVWVLNGKNISPKTIILGTSDGINVAVLSGLNEGDELVYGLKQATKDEVVAEAGNNDSPFMPKPPGKKK